MTAPEPASSAEKDRLETPATAMRQQLASAICYEKGHRRSTPAEARGDYCTHCWSRALVHVGLVAAEVERIVRERVSAALNAAADRVERSAGPEVEAYAHAARIVREEVRRG